MTEMTTSSTVLEGVLAAFLVVLIGGRLRPRPPRRLPSGDGPQPGGARFRVRRPGLLSALRPPRPDHDAAAVAVWCDALARATRSGVTLAAALRATPPPTRHHDAVAAGVLALDRGAPLTEAFDVIGASAPADRDLSLALTVLHACAAHGGPPAEPIDRAAAALRARAGDLADRRTQSAQARSSARVMTVLPIAMLVLLVTTSSSVRGALAGPAGLAALLLGGALNLAGWRWMRSIVDARGSA